MADGDQPKQPICCPVLEYFGKESQLVSTLEINPRIIIFKKPLKAGKTFLQTISIKNKGLYSRSLKYHTDSEEDTDIKVFGIQKHQYLTPTTIIKLEVKIFAKTSKFINRRRHIYIEAEHPSIIFEVPIIVFPRDFEPLYPERIEFPRSIHKTTTYYEFTVFNYTTETINLSYKTYNKALDVNVESQKIKPKQYVRMLLKLKVRNPCPEEGEMKIRFGTCYLAIYYCHEPLLVSLYLSSPMLTFEETRFQRTTIKSFTVCNPTDIAIPFNFEFMQIEKDPKLSTDEGAEADDEFEKTTSSLSSTAERRTINFKTPDDAYQPHIVLNRKYDYKNFKIEPERGDFLPHTSTKITATFTPLINIEDYDDELTPPFLAEASVKLTIPDKEDFDKVIVASGLIDGPEVFISPNTMDFRQVYLGEEHCEQIRITNTDGVVNCEVFFYDHTAADIAKVFITPKGSLFLEPCQQDIIHFTFFTMIVGKIFFKLRFKIKNGRFLTVVVKAESQPVRVKPFPDLVEFGSVPFGVPQKRQVLLINPLSVPITLQCFVYDNGSEMPLVLNVDNVNELPPVDIKNPIENFVNMQNEDNISAYHMSDLDCTESHCSSMLLTYRSAENDECDKLTTCSSSFQNEVIEPISDLAWKVVNSIKNKRIPEKNEPEAKIIREATYELLALPYFSDLTRYHNYAYMDWDAIPSDPQELYFDSEIIHLKPNAGRSLTILIVPNTVGYFNRAIYIRCCPSSHCQDDEFDPSKSTEMLCESSLLVTKLFIEYNCRIPKIVWENQIEFTDQDIYAMQSYDFEMNFENNSNIGGFLHFVLIPSCDQGVMRFRTSQWKFYITANSYETAYCSVEFKKLGDITLTGLIKVVGLSMGVPFHLSAHVLPTRISITPKVIYKRQNVLEITNVTIYITNLTPTKTGFILSLRDGRRQAIDPCGAQLGPNGQGTYVTITSMYRDPEIYKNILYIDLFHTKREIPLTYNITGMPIFFDPDLKKDFDAGTILLSSEEDYDARITNYSQKIRVWNEGERPYSITFQKIKVTTESKSCICPAEPLKAQFFIHPKYIILEPGGVDFIEITAVGCQEAIVYNEFRVVITDQTNAKRFANLRFVLKGTFSNPELVWSPREVFMIYNRKHDLLEFPQFEIVKLINYSNVHVDNIFLQVQGPFKIKELYEDPYVKQLLINMKALEQKEFTIFLNKKEFVKQNIRHFPIMKGRVAIHVDNTICKSLTLRVKVNCPDIVIVESEIVYFTTFEEDFTDIMIENIGLLDAQYKWKKIGECEEYVAEYDDIVAYSRNLLYDLLRMLDLHELDAMSTDTICQKNMTQCYQKYRCLINERPYDDPIGILDIINEMINNLDFEHKRYKLELDETEEDILSETAVSETPSAEKYVKETIDKIFGNLKLEDSYDISEPTEEECDKEEHIYFCTKEGIVLSKHGAKCLLHLPAVKPGYALKAGFSLDVVGGKAQNLLVTLVNLERIVEFMPESYFLGVKPWYEFCTAKVCINNITSYRINVEVTCPKEPRNNHYHLINGYADILTPKVFYLKPYCLTNIRTEGIMGFCDEFIRDVQLRVCDRNLVSFRLRGQGIMPLLVATGYLNWPRIEQTEGEIIEDYGTLQKIYYFTMFKDITFVDEEPDFACPDEEAHEFEKELSFSQISDLSDSDVSSDSSRRARIEKNWQLLLSTYIVAYNDTSLPNPIILEQLMNMVKFKRRLFENQEKRDILHLVYKDYLKMLCTYDEKMPINLKYFTVQPLPYEQLGYVVEMRNLKLNQFRRYQIDLQFLGPGKLTASARTAVKIPGLYIHFEIIEKNERDNFQFYRAEEKMPDFYIRQYRNMWERQIDIEVDPKLQHAHSFDCEGRCKLHKREICTVTAKNRRDIHNYYNSLNKSVYLENKHHFINCTIFSKSKDNFSGTLLRVHILIRPESTYFSEGQVLEDYVYIDLHMGPTLPVLMRGLIR